MALHAAPGRRVGSARWTRCAGGPAPLPAPQVADRSCRSSGQAFRPAATPAAHPVQHGPHPGMSDLPIGGTAALPGTLPPAPAAPPPAGLVSPLDTARRSGAVRRPSGATPAIGTLTPLELLAIEPRRRSEPATRALNVV